MNEADREEIVKGIFKLNMTDICCCAPKWSNSDVEKLISIITKQDKVMEAVIDYRMGVEGDSLPKIERLDDVLNELEGGE